MTGSKRKEAIAAAMSNKKQRQDEQGSGEEQKQVEQRVVRLSPISRLYRDALESVFDFLWVDDLSRAMAVSRSWRAAVGQMPCARLSVSCSTARLVALCMSELSKHVNTIGCVDDVKSELSCEALYTLSLRLPQLIDLECTIVPSPVGVVVLPRELDTLNLNLSKLAISASNAIVKSISQLSALSELNLALPSFDPAFGFSSFAALASLEDLELSSKVVESQPTEVQLDQLRALPRLRRMAVARLSSLSLVRLLRKPHELRWQEIHVLKRLDAAASGALSALPSLTTLNTDTCLDIRFLMHSVQLQSLDLHLVQPWIVSVDAVVEGLSCCTQLTDLTLTAPLNSKHLSVLLPRLPLLTKLCFWRMNELESLTCLSGDPIVARLQNLRLYACNHTSLRSRELQHVYALTALEFLTIDDSFTEPLSDLDLWLHTPPSKLMPKLKSFNYTHYDD